MIEKTFNINSTNACKGVALVFLLWHHLFDELPEFGFITVEFASLSKVCVAIFVILSGYGFSESVKLKNIGLFAFYKKRFVALYSNYWFIALVFVPIGILFFDRTFHDVFTSHAYAKFVIQMIGVHRFAYSEYGYNATWWYLSVIIPLIILFPFLYDLIKKYGVLILILCFFILIPNRSMIPVINTWLLPFALGIYFSLKNFFVTTSNHLNYYGNWRFIILIAALLPVAIYRDSIPLIGGTKIDWLLGSLMIMFVFEISKTFKLVQVVLGFLGKHLFNIFLFHTFIYYYYWSGFIYSFQNPVLIFLALLFICTVISIMVEEIKKRVYFYKLIDKINKLQVPSYIEIPFQQNAPGEVDGSCLTVTKNIR